MCDHRERRSRKIAGLGIQCFDFPFALIKTMTYTELLHIPWGGGGENNNAATVFQQLQTGRLKSCSIPMEL